MTKEKLIYLPIGLLTTITGASGAVLASHGASAVTNATCTTTSGVTTCAQSISASVTVTEACSLSTVSGGGAKTGTFTPGVHDTTTFADVSTFEAVCNDASGVKIFAVGYTNDTYGSNVLNGGDSGNIASGTETSGTTSNWSMKVADGGNVSYPATIASSFSDYATVPTTNQLVASYAGSTGTSSGVRIKTSYGIFVAAGQTSGSYTGKVKYTVVKGSASTPTS